MLAHAQASVHVMMRSHVCCMSIGSAPQGAALSVPKFLHYAPHALAEQHVRNCMHICSLHALAMLLLPLLTATR